MKVTYEHKSNGVYVQTRDSINGPVQRITWVQVGHTYAVQKLHGDVVKTGVLVSFDGICGRLKAFETNRQSTVYLRDLVETGDDYLRSASFNLVKTKTLRSMRDVDRSAERIEDGQIENVTFAANKNTSKRRSKKQLCDVCQTRTCLRRFKVCFLCWNTKGRPKGKVLLDWLKSVWTERRAQQEKERGR